jgi:hypothetical protein
LVDGLISFVYKMLAVYRSLGLQPNFCRLRQQNNNKGEEGEEEDKELSLLD